MTRILYLFLSICLCFFVLSCQDEKQDKTIDRDEPAYISLLLDLPRTQVDSIQKAESRKTLILTKKRVEIDSATHVDIMLSPGYIAEPGYFNTDIILQDDKDDAGFDKDGYYKHGNDGLEDSPEFSDPDNDNVNQVLIRGVFSEDRDGDVITLIKSKDPNLFQVSTIKEINDVAMTLHEDKNTLLFIDNFGDTRLYYRNYNPENETYYLYTAQIPKYNDKKLRYVILFDTNERAKNLLAFEKATDLKDVSWKKIKQNIPPIDLFTYKRYYTSLEKEIKYFLSHDEYVHIKQRGIDLLLYREGEDGQNRIDVVESLNYLNYSGYFRDIPFPNHLMSLFSTYGFNLDDNLLVINKIDKNNTVIKIQRNNQDSFHNDEPMYFILSSIKTNRGQFYLLSETNQTTYDLNLLMNVYFSHHLKI